jgi:hypothetical protein
LALKGPVQVKLVIIIMNLEDFMRRISHFNLALALTLAGATGLSMLAPVEAVHAAKKKKEEAPKYELSKEYREAYVAAQSSMEAGNLAEAKTQADAIAAMAANQDEKYLAGQLYLMLGGKMSDTSVQRTGLEMSLDSGRVAPADAANYNFYIGNFAYADKDYAKARQYLNEAFRLGYSNLETEAEALLAEAYFQEDMNQQGLKILADAIAARETAGKEVPINWYKRGISVAYNANLGAESTQWAKLLIAAEPNKQNWRDALTIYRNMNDSLGSQESLDVMRLMRRADALAGERDYAEYVEFADVRRLPGEVKSLLSEGQSKGAINTSNSFFAEQLSLANDRISADRASLGDAERDAAAASNGTIALGTADAHLGYGNAEKAQMLYKTAIEKGGIDTERAQMRLAIAAADAGDYATAKQEMAKVGGARAELASFWMIWLDQQMAPQSVTAAAPVAASVE